MQMSQLVPISSLAQRFGVKSLIYGAPGTYKTPLIATAPRPVVLVTEPGMLSVRHLNNIPAWQAFTKERIDEFAAWLDTPEARNFDTICVDSTSQVAEIMLEKAKAQYTDGRKQYGFMSENTMKLINKLYYMPNKHVYLICKESAIETGNVKEKRPYFPGQELNVKVPHMFDEVLYIDYVSMNGSQPILAIRCKATFGILARDRSARLNEFEEPNLTKLFTKCMS
jgi:hypothetical protein